MDWDKEKDFQTIRGGYVYRAEVIDAVDSYSQKGNPTIKLTLLVAVGGSQLKIKDTVTPAYAKKLKHFCRSAGIEDQYNAGSIETFSLMGCVVYFRTAQEENAFGYFPIDDYITEEEYLATKPEDDTAITAIESKNEETPF